MLPILEFHSGVRGDLVARAPDGRVVLPARGERVEAGIRLYVARRLVLAASGRAYIAHGLTPAAGVLECWHLSDRGAELGGRIYDDPARLPAHTHPTVRAHVERLHREYTTCPRCGGSKESTWRYCRRCSEELFPRAPEPEFANYPVPVPDPPSHQFPSEQDIMNGAPMFCSCGAKLEVMVGVCESQDRDDVHIGIARIECPREHDDWRAWGESLPAEWRQVWDLLVREHFYGPILAGQIINKYARAGKSPAEWERMYWLPRIEE
jgi:hypothetical protein